MESDGRVVAARSVVQQRLKPVGRVIEARGVEGQCLESGGSVVETGRVAEQRTESVVTQLSIGEPLCGSHPQR